ncbi:MAG: sulfite exporter TauE/SafE family protein [Pseudomonadota bacterium]
MLDALALSPMDLSIISILCFLAGMVRGFSGFALSALVMATAIYRLPPVELIPMLWWLELVASLLMVRDGWKDADRRIAIILVLGSAIGTPLGLAVTTSISAFTSSIIALIILLGLAALQLAKVRMPFLATTPGTSGTGLLAGIITGLNGAGGMLIALYVLAQERPANVMRATLVIFLFATSFFSMVAHLSYGTMNGLALWRGLVFAAPTAAGVMLGQLLFTERWAPYYRPFCLVLLIGLAFVSLLRTLVM